jgi:hypothetical protein
MSLGPDHPSTMTVRNNLASLEAALGKSGALARVHAPDLILRSPRSRRLEG